MNFYYENVNCLKNHNYSMVLSRPGKKDIALSYPTRVEANEKMYQLISKYNLKVKTVYEDHHDYTYNCIDGSKFFIDREL